VIRYRSTTGTGGGGTPPPTGIPAGAAVMSDSVSLAATVFLGESTPVPVDASTQALRTSYAESNVTATDAARLGVAGLTDAVGAQAELLGVGVTQSDTSAAQADAARLALSGFADTVAGQGETLETGFAGSGLADANPAPTEGRTATTFTYATTQVSVGNGATNGANALGRNDGTSASVTTVALGATTCSVTPKIPRASISNSGTYTLYAWYKTTAGVAGAAGLTLTYTDTGGNPVNITLTQGDFSVTPFTATITSLHPTNDITVLFQVIDTAAGVSPGIILVDAVAIRTVGAF
jgi:hypothetical protein